MQNKLMNSWWTKLAYVNLHQLKTWVCILNFFRAHSSSHHPSASIYIPPSSPAYTQHPLVHQRQQKAHNIMLSALQLNTKGPKLNTSACNLIGGSSQTHRSVKIVLLQFRTLANPLIALEPHIHIRIIPYPTYTVVN